VLRPYDLYQLYLICALVAMGFCEVTAISSLLRHRNAKKLDSRLRGNDSVAQKLIPISISCEENLWNRPVDISQTVASLLLA